MSEQSANNAMKYAVAFLLVVGGIALAWQIPEWRGVIAGVFGCIVFLAFFWFLSEIL